jgi:hypothetical protein
MIDSTTFEIRGTDTGSRLEKEGMGMSSTEVYAFIRDVLIYRMTRHQLDTLRGNIEVLIERLDEKRDKTFGNAEDWFSDEVKQWLQGVRTQSNPLGDVKTIQAIKWCRAESAERFGYTMGLKEAKEYVETYIDAFKRGEVPALAQDQRPRWMKEDEIPEDLLTPAEKRAINSALPPWDAMSHVVNRRQEAVHSIMGNLGYFEEEAESLVKEYEKRARAGTLTCKLLSPEDSIVGSDEFVEMEFDAFLDED